MEKDVEITGVVVPTWRMYKVPCKEEMFPLYVWSDAAYADVVLAELSAVHALV